MNQIFTFCFSIWQFYNITSTNTYFIRRRRKRGQLSSAGRPVRQKAVGTAVSERTRKAGIQNAGLRVRSQGAAEKRRHVESLVARIL